MNKLMELIKAIDQFLFQNIDTFKNSPQYEQLMEAISKVDDKYRKHVQYLICIAIILPSFLLLSILFLNTWSSKNKVETKKEIIQRINSLSEQQKRMVSLKNKMANLKAAENLKALKKNISRLGVSSSKLDVTNFEQQSKKDKTSTSSKTISADIGFKKLNLSELTTLLANLMSKNKARITELKIVRTKDTKLLNGNISILQFKKE